MGKLTFFMAIRYLIILRNLNLLYALIIISILFRYILFSKSPVVDCEIIGFFGLSICFTTGNKSCFAYGKIGLVRRLEKSGKPLSSAFICLTESLTCISIFLSIPSLSN